LLTRCILIDVRLRSKQILKSFQPGIQLLKTLADPSISKCFIKKIPNVWISSHLDETLTPKLAEPKNPVFSLASTEFQHLPYRYLLIFEYLLQENKAICELDNSSSWPNDRISTFSSGRIHKTRPLDDGSPSCDHFLALQILKSASWWRCWRWIDMGPHGEMVIVKCWWSMLAILGLSEDSPAHFSCAARLGSPFDFEPGRHDPELPSTLSLLWWINF